MSRRPNPTRIGLFLLGALIIVIIGTAILASATWFQQRTMFISFFPESVNGLADGAPVKFQGVPVGTVKAINIRIDQRDNSFQVPVEFDIDLRRLTTPNGTYVNLADTVVLRQQIAKGLRAQLQMQSLLTGQLYVDIDIRPPKPQPVADSGAADPPLPPNPVVVQNATEIPTTDTAVQALKNQLDGMDFRRQLEDLTANAGSARASWCSPKATPVCMRSRPRSRSRKRVSSVSASSISARICLLRAKKASPSGVSASLRVERLSSLTPSLSSRRVTSLERADGVRLNSRAAAEKPPSSTERTKASI
jgi:hypothetical protein